MIHSQIMLNHVISHGQDPADPLEEEEFYQAVCFHAEAEDSLRWKRVFMRDIYIYIPIGSMYAIYGNIYHQYIYIYIYINIPQMLAYIPYMDPMGYIIRYDTWNNTWYNMIYNDIHYWGQELMKITWGASLHTYLWWLSCSRSLEHIHLSTQGNPIFKCKSSLRTPDPRDA